MRFEDEILRKFAYEDKPQVVRSRPPLKNFQYLMEGNPGALFFQTQTFFDHGGGSFS